MSTDFNTLTNYFRGETETVCEVDEENQSIKTWLKTPSGVFKVSMRLFSENIGTLLFLTKDIITVPKEYREKAHHLINLINYDLLLGNFEMNTYSGEVSYRNAFCVCDANITEKQISHTIRSSVGLANQYAPSFQRMIWGEKNPVEAHASVADESAPGIDESDPGIPQEYATEVIQQVEEMLDIKPENDDRSPRETNNRDDIS